MSSLKLLELVPAFLIGGLVLVAIVTAVIRFPDRIARAIYPRLIDDADQRKKARWLRYRLGQPFDRLLYERRFRRMAAQQGLLRMHIGREPDEPPITYRQLCRELERKIPSILDAPGYDASWLT